MAEGPADGAFRPCRRGCRRQEKMMWRASRSAPADTSPCRAAAMPTATNIDWPENRPPALSGPWQTRGGCTPQHRCPAHARDAKKAEI